MLHPPAQQPQIEPDKHADRYGQRENVRCFYNGEGPDGLSNSSADVAVLHPLDDGGNLLHEKTSVSKKNRRNLARYTGFRGSVNAPKDYGNLEIARFLHLKSRNS